MKPTVLLTLLLLITYTANAGDWVFRPIANGQLHISQQGVAEQGPDMLVQRQVEGKSLMLQVTPAGMGRCENGVLSGSDSLSTVHIPLTTVFNGVSQPGRNVQCGESVLFDASAHNQLVGVKAKPHTGRMVAGNIPATLVGQRVLLGYINFIEANNNNVVSNPIYLDLTTLGDSVPALKASFNKPALQFGQVSMLKENLYNARLTINKTPDAGDAAISYKLAFESSQQRNNSFQLKSAQGDIYVPYRVKIGNKRLVCGFIARNT